jgi:hypothetical protein
VVLSICENDMAPQHRGFMRSGPVGYMGRGFGGPTTECNHPHCNATIPSEVLRHKTQELGQKCICITCTQAKRGTRYFKYIPGSERERSNGDAARDPPRNAWGTRTNSKDPLLLQMQKMQKQLDEYKKAGGLDKPDKTNNNGAQGAHSDKGMPQDVKDLLKKNAENKAELLALSAAQKALCFGTEEAFEAKLKEVQAERDNIFAQNRANLPIKTQHNKCNEYLDRLVGELDDYKSKQTEALLLYNSLDVQIKEKQSVIDIKKVELASLSVKMAAEDAVETPLGHSMGEDGVLPVATAPEPILTDPRDVEFFKAMVEGMDESNMQTILESKKADTYDFQRMASIWKAVAQAAIPTTNDANSTNPFKPPDVKVTGKGKGVGKTADVVEAAAEAKSSSSAPEVGVDLDFDEKWKSHLQDHGEILAMDVDEMRKAKDAFYGISAHNKRAKIS